MAIEAAIFDCDGTILDSMPMWAHECVSLLERYGVERAPEVFLAHESLDMDKKCLYYHDAYGIGESGEALFRELWDSVSRAYARDVLPYPGIRDFLGRLKEAGIACVVASSTPTELLARALDHHGLSEYFDEFIFCGDVGRSKEYPDVYLAAQRRLGTAREATWVFEDAPFGIRSARRAGFPVVGILNDHDGRDEAFVERWSSVLCTDYRGLDVECLRAQAPKTFRACIVGGSPESSDAALIRSLNAQADLTIACDRGCDVLLAEGIDFDICCGDMDTIAEASRRVIVERGIAQDVHDPIKDETDLSLAFALVEREAENKGMPAETLLTCVSGGRADHALGVLGVCARNARLRPRIEESGHTVHFLSPEGRPTCSLKASFGTTLSVVSLMGKSIVSEEGTFWELDESEIEPLSDLGISNRIIADEARVSCSRGCVAAFHIATDISS